MVRIGLILILLALGVALYFVYSEPESVVDPAPPPETGERTQANGARLSNDIDDPKQQNESMDDPVRTLQLPGGDGEYEYGDFVRITEQRSECSTEAHIYSAGRRFVEETCIRQYQFDHPYAYFSDEQLEQIAATDGEAAFILAHRQLVSGPEDARDTEAGLNNVLSAVLRGGGKQAFSLLFEGDAFSPHEDLEGYLLWATVGSNLDLLTEQESERLDSVWGVSPHIDADAITTRAIEIQELLANQRLIVVGETFEGGESEQ